MTHHKSTTRVLAVAPCSKGFGFAVLEESFRLVDWGVKSVSGDKNARSMAKLEALITHYSPMLLAVPDISHTGQRKPGRIERLIGDIVKMADKRGLEVQKASRNECREYFPNARASTKDELASLLAERFPEELGAQLPRKRRPWMSEDYRMNIFTAVALAIVCRWKQSKQTQNKRDENEK